MHAPAFWQRDGVLPKMLAPLAWVWAAGAARRAARPGWRAPVPVICCGNVTVGGAGKTTLALDLGARLGARGVQIAFLTRGHGGTLGGAARVDPAHHTAAQAGDEALLLAAVAPTYVAADRAAGARAALAEGARLLLLDDGLQNPTLAKDLSFLVIDGASGFGNGRVLPAGPLREPVKAAAARCQAAVLIGPDETGVAGRLDLPILHASLAPGPEIELLRGKDLFAFAGIGRPGKLFNMLEQSGMTLVGRRAFPDHHRYTQAELLALRDAAAARGAVLVTTPKDAARLAPAERAGITVVGVRLDWAEPEAIERLLGG